MERAVKHARIMAVINAPADIVKRCVESQGISSRFEQSYAINEQIRNWLIEHVLDNGDSSLVIPVEEKSVPEDMGPALPALSTLGFAGEVSLLPAVPAIINDDQVQAIIKKWDLFDAEFNPGGRFANVLVDSGHPLTLLDRRTALLWQRGGLDICSMRTMQKNIEAINRKGLAGYHDWRLPTLEEALSLMEPVAIARECIFILVFPKSNRLSLWQPNANPVAIGLSIINRDAPSGLQARFPEDSEGWYDLPIEGPGRAG